MKTLTITATEETAKRIHSSLIHTFASKAYEKFQGECAGKFNRYNVFAGKFLVYFESDTRATVMTYDEALSLPTLAEKCKETWGDD